MWRWGVGRGLVGLVGMTVAAVAFVAGLVSSGDAAFPGRNGRIAFVWDPDISARPQSCGDIFSIKPNGLGRRRLTPGCPWLYSDPAYSATGHRIAFIRASEPFPRRHHGAGIYVMDASGSNVRRITVSRYDQNPVISPNGRWILFDRYLKQRSRTQLFRVSIAGGPARQLTRGPGAADGTLSPDGAEIAFVGGGSDIFMMRVDGSRERQLTHSRARFESWYVEPDFSPNGRRLVAVCGAGDFGAAAQVCIMKTDGTHLEELTPARRLVAEDPVFSPDGRQIAFLAQVSCRSRCRGNGDLFLYTMQTDGSHLRRIANLGPNQEPGSLAVSWQPLP